MDVYEEFHLKAFDALHDLGALIKLKEQYDVYVNDEKVEMEKFLYLMDTLQLDFHADLEIVEKY